MKAAVVSERGRRLEMEDTYFLDLNFAKKGWGFGGIYDGHRGGFASEYASEYLHQKFLERLNSGLSPQEAFTGAYQAISEALRYQESGTTAVNFFIREGEVFTANVGDARAIIIGPKEHYQLTVDHRLDNPEEKRRIVEMGGRIHYPYVMRGSQGLMPTRAMGDEYFESVGVIATPFVNVHTISEGDLVLLAACDGLFDVMDNDEVADFARKSSDIKELLEVLQREALVFRFGWDNLTIIGIDLKDQES